MKTKRTFFRLRGRFFLIIIGILCSSGAIKAQTGSLQGRVIDGGRLPVISSSITLTPKIDSLRIIKTKTDSMGNFIMKGLTFQVYNLSIEASTYESTKRSGIVLSGQLDLGDIILYKKEQSLGEVTISTTRSTVVQKPDRTTLNVSGNISSTGANVLDILSRAPGINASEKGISLRGKQGVSVMIDGKLQPLSGEELIAFLKGLPASAVDKIDLINAPSSKYDAAGNGGVIDIKTKKNSATGLNGGLNANFIQGRYSRQNGGFNLSYATSSLDLQASYNLQNNNDFNSSTGFRQFLPPSAMQDRFEQSYFYKIDANIHNAQLGLIYSLGKTLKLNLSSRIYANNNTRFLDNLNTRLSAQGDALTRTRTIGRSDYSRLNPNLTLGVKHNTKNGIFGMDIDYANYKTQTRQVNRSSGNTEAGMTQSGIVGNLNGKLPILSIKADYDGKIDSLLDEFSAGVKFSNLNATNTTNFADYSGQSIPGLTNDFDYKEQIFASYLNGKRKIGKLSLQLGLRYEYTRVAAGQLGTGDIEGRRYGQLFPNASVDFSINKVHRLGFSVYKRIVRPTFRQLNPFRFYLNDNTYAIGNLDILPQTTMSYELSHQVKDFLFFTYTYSKIRNSMFTVLEEDAAQPGVVRMIDRNLAQADYYGLNIAVPIHLDNWLKAFNSFTLYKNFYRGVLAGTTLANGQLSWMVSSNQSFQISPTWSAESTLNYYGKNRDGLQVVSPVFTAMFAVQKQVLAKKLNLKLTLSDAFYSNISRFSTQSALYNDSVSQRIDSQLLTLGLSYRFGHGGGGTKNKKNTTDEIKQRAN